MSGVSIIPLLGADLTRGVISFSSTGDNVVVAAITSPSNIVQVYRMFFVVGAATNVTIKDGVAGTALTGALPFAANGALTIDHSGDPWFVTTAGNAFVINQSGTAQISGAVWYTQRS